MEGIKSVIIIIIVIITLIGRLLLQIADKGSSNVHPRNAKLICMSQEP